MVVKTRVISSFNAWNVPLRTRLPLLEPDDPPDAERCFSSSSANSRTFQGYNVVIAISAAWSKASKVKMPNHMVSLDANSLVVSGTMGASGLRLGIPPDACAGSRERRGVCVRKRVAKAKRSP